MKTRIGYAPGGQRSPGTTASFASLVDGLERVGFDSLWCSERATGALPDPMVALAFAAGRTTRIKLGTSVQVLPGRNPVHLAKAWATLDVLSNGRALPAFGLGAVDPAEQQAFGIERGARASWFEEALPLVRRLWSEDAVDHDGERFHYEGATIGTLPLQQPLDVWLGGRAPVELRRVGRLADGWLPSFCTPAQVASDRAIVDEAAAAAGRTIDPEHFGAIVLYSRAPLPAAQLQALAARPTIDPSDVIVTGLDALRDRLAEFVAVGFTKLVPMPMHEITSWDDELEAVGAAVLDLQN
jgi:probable F420-dependent oxidoreductase